MDEREERINDLAEAKIAALPLHYRMQSGEMSRWTNIEDAMDGIKQDTLIRMARLVIAKDDAELGKVFREAIEAECRRQAENEVE